MTTPYEVVTDRLIALMEKGTVPWRRPWRVDPSLGVNVNRPTNGVSGKPYRGYNFLVLAAVGMGYTSNLWLTFNQTKKAGGTVRPGEKGTAVIYWQVNEYPDPNDPTKVKKVPFMKYYSVFNLDQTEGVTLPKKFRPMVVVDGAEPTPEPDPVEAAEAVVAKYFGRKGAPGLSLIKSARAFYEGVKDAITAPLRSQYANGHEYYSTLFHEMGHSTGHTSRLDRPHFIHNAFGDDAYSKEELVAEMTAAFLCAETGIDNSTIENSAAYIAGWSKKFREDPKVLINAASQAQRAADYILGVAEVQHMEEAA